LVNELRKRGKHGKHAAENTVRLVKSG
jgi:hypothetical protein